jgi:hypothetical protein
MKRTPLQRTRGLGRTTRPDVVVPPKGFEPSDEERAARQRWTEEARKRPCAMCGRGPSQGHHVITQQELKHVARAKRVLLMTIRWDLRNMLPLCESCHERHHKGICRVPLLLAFRLCPGLDDFARECDRMWWLARYYQINGSVERSVEDPFSGRSRPVILSVQDEGVEKHP